MQVPVGRAAVALVDDADYLLVAQFTWEPCGSGRIMYARRRWWDDGTHRVQRMHALILGTAGVDHVDGDGLNNQRSNLRLATKAQNAGNMPSRPGSRSRYKGVSWNNRDQRWRAGLALGQPHGRYLGEYRDEEDAARAYDQAATEHFGEYALLNFPATPGARSAIASGS